MIAILLSLLSIVNARAHDVNHLNILVEGFNDLCSVDKGFMDPFRQPLLYERYGVKIVTPNKVNMKDAHSRAFRKFRSRIRKIVETVESHLTERFGVGKIRVHDLWHFQHRLIRKVLSYAVIVF